ncbi:CLIP-associated protein [Galdieria sulphuraria]|nr:CLIP-associated protein [Galdieria sulphuraria]
MIVFFCGYNKKKTLKTLSQVQQVAQKIKQSSYSSELEKKLAKTCLEWLERIREQENQEPNEHFSSHIFSPLQIAKELSGQRANRGLALHLESVISVPCPTLLEESSSSMPRDSSESNLDWGNLSRELTEFQKTVSSSKLSINVIKESKDTDSQDSNEASHAFLDSPNLSARSAQSHCGYQRSNSITTERSQRDCIQTCPPHPYFQDNASFHSNVSLHGGFGLTRRLSFTSSRIRNDENNITKLPIVEPLFVKTKKELRYWMNWINQNIHMEEEWEKRVLALRKIRSLLLGKSAAGNEMMSEFLKNIRWAIQKNINDRRSIVVRETCETIQLLSFHVDSNTFDVLFLQFFDPLCRNCANTIFVIASCADQCIRECIKNSSSLSFLVKLIQATESLHGVLRQKGFEWIALTLQLVTPQQLQIVHKPSRETYWIKLQRAVEKGIRDKLQQVRDEARKCEQSMQIMQNLDTKTTTFY